MRNRQQRRKGNVVVFVAICLTAVLGFVALALDGGMLLDERRDVQAAADMSALAAAENLYANWQTNQGLDTGGTAAAQATALATANGFSNIQVNIPPQSGYFVGQPGYAEVIVTANQARAFSVLWGTGSLPVQARAVAQGRWVPSNMGILVLNPTAPGALTNTGSGSMTVAGVPTIVDSNSASAATATGGGTVTSPEIDVTGVPGISGSGNWVGTVNDGQPPVPDPLAYLPEPDPSTMVVQSKNPTHIAGQNTTVLYPGVYKGGITVTGQGMLVMEPGIYYMDGGGFSFSGLGGMTAAGVMIVNAPNSNSDNISINGNGAINFSPPTSGIYQGISLWQVRSATNTIYVNGNGGSSMSGTFYTANGTLNVGGNGTNDVIGSQYISYNLTLGGNGSFSVNWNANQVGKTRIIELVE
jgi:Flp pilus assembly protein TadG